jgi:hypothetical protein
LYTDYETALSCLMGINRLLLRADTTSAWRLANPVLALNELVFDETKQDFKRGDGVNTFIQLPYLLQEQTVWRGLFVPGYYREGQYVEAADGQVYRARRTITFATAQPVAGPNWIRPLWSTNTSSSGPLSGATITRWEPSTYSSGLVVVLYNFTLYELTVEERPFDSLDIELEKDYGFWTAICCEGGGATDPTADFIQSEDGRRLQTESGEYLTT